MDDANTLIKQHFGKTAAQELHGLLDTARQAGNQEEWDDATRIFRERFRTLVKAQLKEFIPPPILALPGVRALVDQILDQALVNGELTVLSSAREISLGPASASLNMPAVMLNPPNLPGLKTTLIGFKPPTGISLDFKGGPVSGGGGLDYQSSPFPRLSGLLGLKMGILSVSGLSIIEEESGFVSVMTLLSGRFSPGVQIGLGFAISGIGGLIGINRAVNAAALEAQFRTGVLSVALFGDNPAANAITTLNTLSTVFHPQLDKHVFGPSMQLSWLKVGTFTLFNADLGVFMQLPGPSRIDIIGTARAGIPALFRLQFDLRGEIDNVRGVIGIHAIIVDSHVMGIFRLQGEALFRMRYLDDPYVVLTIGGFFPGFNPAPAELPATIHRVGMTLDIPIKLPLYLRVEGYLAVTSNTLQFGALMEAGFDAGLFSADGHFYLDALFQFDPFAFDVRFSAGFHIKVIGRTFSGVTCSGTITGPGPVVIHARITYRTPFFLPNISWNDTFTIGRQEHRIAGSADIFASMKKELNPANIYAENGDDRHVALKMNGSSENSIYTLLSPLGDLLWTQRLAPLNIELERLQNTPLTKAEGVQVTTEKGNPVDPKAPRERYSLGMYRNLNDSDRLNLNGQTESHVSGVRHHYDMQNGARETIAILFDEFHHPEPPAPDQNMHLHVKRLSHALLNKVSDRAVQAGVTNLDGKVSIKREEWQAGDKTFDTRAGSHIAAKKFHQVSHLAMDTIDVGGV